MHEMSVVLRLTGIALKVAEQNCAAVVERVIVQVGEMSGYVPRYLYAYYPAAVRGTLLEGSQLTVETLPARLVCLGCGTDYRPEKTDVIRCPLCKSAAFRIEAGTEVFVKEIVIIYRKICERGLITSKFPIQCIDKRSNKFCNVFSLIPYNEMTPIFSFFIYLFSK